MAVASSSSCWAIRSGLSLVGVHQALGVGMERDVVGFGARDVAVRALDLFLGVVDGGIRFIDLRDEFWNLENGQHLAVVHAVADVDIDLLDVSGDLGVDLNVLVRNELARNRKLVGDRLTFGDGDGGARWGRGGGSLYASAAHTGDRNDAISRHTSTAPARSRTRFREASMFFLSSVDVANESDETVYSR